MKIIAKICHDHDRPGCLQTTDPAYTMRFDDIREEPLYFCSFCGPDNFKLLKKIEEAFKANGTEFAEKLQNAVTKFEKDNEYKHRNKE